MWYHCSKKFILIFLLSFNLNFPLPFIPSSLSLLKKIVIKYHFNLTMTQAYTIKSRLKSLWDRKLPRSLLIHKYWVKNPTLSVVRGNICLFVLTFKCTFNSFCWIINFERINFYIFNFRFNIFLLLIRLV